MLATIERGLERLAVWLAAAGALIIVVQTLWISYGVFMRYVVGKPDGTVTEATALLLFPAALPGIVAGIMLAVSRAIGETMIVVMAAGYTANLTANPFDTITTITVQIVALLTGDQDFGSPHTLAAFALGLTLFVTTFFLNYAALRVVKKYREAYE